MSNEAPHGRSAEDTEALNEPPEQNHDPIGDYLEPEVDTDALLQGLKSGQLTPSQQEALAGILVEDEPHQHVMAVQQQTTMYSGSLPHTDHFNSSSIRAAQSCRWPWRIRNIPTISRKLA